MLICLILYIGLVFWELVRDGERIRDTLWASFWGKEVPHVGCLHAEVVDRAVPVLFLAAAVLRVCGAVFEAFGSAGRRGGAVGSGGAVVNTIAFQLCVSVPAAEVLAVPAKNDGNCVGFSGGFSGKRSDQLAFHLRAGFWSDWCCCGFGYFLVGFSIWFVRIRRVWRVSSDLVRLFHGSIFWALGVRQALCCFWGHALVNMLHEIFFIFV